MTDQEFSCRYWAENFSRDVETFLEYWESEQRQRPQEYPTRMTLSDWDRQFVAWLNNQGRENKT